MTKIRTLPTSSTYNDYKSSSSVATIEASSVSSSSTSYSSSDDDDERASSSHHRETSHPPSHHQQHYHHHQSDDESYERQEKNLRIHTTSVISKLAIEAMEAATEYTASTTVSEGSSYQQPHHQMWNEEDLLELFTNMQSTTDSMIHAWKRLHKKIHTISEEKLRTQCRNDVPFREIYMDRTTKAFATELDDMRCGRNDFISTSSKGKQQGAEKKTSILDQDNIVMPDNNDDENNSKGPAIDVDVLIRSLHSGMDVYTSEERQLLIDEPMSSNSSSEDARGVGALLTPHEQRRRLLFGTL